MTSASSKNLRFLPVGLDVRGKHCVVIGGGSVGARKVANLSRAGAEVSVVSPAVSEKLAGIIESSGIRLLREQFQEDHLEGVFLAVAATDNEVVNAFIVESAGKRGILVCDASSAERSQIIFGALHRDETGTTVAVFTDGRDPSAARRTRDRIAGLLTQESEQEDQLG